MNETAMKELEENILMALPYLRNIEVGQRFYSVYYGIITATKVTKHEGVVYSIYGFDEKDGSPRGCYYPRDLKLLGKNIMLNDVLYWLKGLQTETHSINKYGIFHDRDWNGSCSWDLSKPYLKDQNENLINWLKSLI